MSTRSQVYIKDTEVYLYQHADGMFLHKIVQNALRRKERWNDVGYLTRIIFSHMISKNIFDSTGYGIDNFQHGDIAFLTIINVEDNTICVKSSKRVLFCGTFNEFIKKNLNKNGIQLKFYDNN